MTAIWRRLSALVDQERGDSLLEVLISVSLTAIALGAIFGAISGVSLAAHRENQFSTLESVLSQARQTVETAPYSAAGTYPTPSPIPATATIPPYTVTAVSGVSNTQAITITVIVGDQTRGTTIYKSCRRAVDAPCP